MVCRPKWLDGVSTAAQVNYYRCEPWQLVWTSPIKGKAGIARALYIAAKEQRVVILRAFVKKTEKTPAGETRWRFRGRRS